MTLPVKLSDAEDQIFNSINDYISKETQNRISINLKFEGLRIMPVAFRLFKRLAELRPTHKLLWADAGATALAKRDAPELEKHIMSFKDILTRQPSEFEEYNFIAVSPQHYDYEVFESICSKFSNRIIMLNGKLDDSAVGIGSVARDRRKNFISRWQNVYWLEPLKNGALIHKYPSNWTLLTAKSGIYEIVDSYDEKPSSDTIFESLLTK